jgi:aromatic ring-opening dioxygenase catalytic subunit (LigB family)
MTKEMPGVYDQLAESLRDLPRQLGAKPKAVLMVSGHWEAREFTVMANPQPPMLYDYGGFPPYTYEIQYNAPGSPELAKRVLGLLKGAGLAAKSDADRGFDHGAFVPMAVMYPDADVPMVQLSLRSDFNPVTHLAMGRALAPLRDEGILILGSGLSYHNLRQFFGPGAHGPSHWFDAWLQETVLESTPRERTDRLLFWADAPAARQAHPREDHLIPLLVALGAAEHEKGALVYHESAFMNQIAVSSFRFG